MHSARISKTHYFAAFFLGSLIALLVVSPAHSKEVHQDFPDTSISTGSLQ
jgi:hypothetical protein